LKVITEFCTSQSVYTQTTVCQSVVLYCELLLVQPKLFHFSVAFPNFLLRIFVNIPLCFKLIQGQMFKVTVAIHVQICVSWELTFL